MQYFAIYLKNDCLFAKVIDPYDAAKYADDHTDKILDGYKNYPRKIVLISDITELYPHIASFLKEHRKES